MAEENRPLLGPEFEQNGEMTADACATVSPKITSLVIKRIMTMTTKLLPIEVNPEELKSPTSGIITKDVIEAYRDCAGDFADCVPYCLLTARQKFHKLALRDPSDYDENLGRQVACEVLARRIVSTVPKTRRHIILSTRYTRFESDGDETLPTSTIELACDQQATIFLSSSESQNTIFALWNGYLVQALDNRGHVVYDVYKSAGKGGFLQHFDVSRLAVPRYNNIFRIVLWVFFLVWYSIAIQTPDRDFGLEDILLYIQVFGYLLELITRAYKISNISTFTFWFAIDLIIYSVLCVAFGYRIADLNTHDPEKTAKWRLTAFQLTSTVAPLVWAKLLPVFDTWPFFGTLQIVVTRMLRESAVFFALLILLGIGFAQSLIGLDAADKSHDLTETVFHSLLQGMLGSPSFDVYGKGQNGYPYNTVIYYLWNVSTTVILLNVLVALFGSAYQDVTDDAMNFYLAFFGAKAVTAVRAPDSYVYCAPFNLFELLVLPLEPFVTRETYAGINRIFMRTVFFFPLCAIALFESTWEDKHLRRFSEEMDLEEEEDDVKDPETPEDGQDDERRSICVHSFETLTHKFPDLTTSIGGTTLREVLALKKELEIVQLHVRHLQSQATSGTSEQVKIKEES